MELAAVLCIKRERAASVPAPSARGFVGFSSVGGGALRSRPPLASAWVQPEGIPRGDFHPKTSAKGKMAFDRPGFPIGKVKESVAPPGAQEGTGGASGAAVLG